MKKLVTGALCAALLALQAEAKVVENKFVMDIMPGSAQIHEDTDGFTNSTAYDVEEISGVASFAPTIGAGYGLDIPFASFELTGGVGALVNGAFYAIYTKAELAAYVTTRQKGFMIGPFVRYVNISDPEWATDNLSMEGTTALAYGIGMMTGGKKVKFKLRVGTLTGADIAVRGENGYKPSSPVISLDGTTIEMGIALRF